jgi:hypothetical protein
MPEPTDFEALRREVFVACRQLEHDNRTYLKGVLLRLVDAIEAVSPPTGWTPELLTLAEFEAKLAAIRRGWELRTGVCGQGDNVTASTERRECDA